MAATCDFTREKKCLLIFYSQGLRHHRIIINDNASKFPINHIIMIFPCDNFEKKFLVPIIFVNETFPF